MTKYIACEITLQVCIYSFNTNFIKDVYFERKAISELQIAAK